MYKELSELTLVDDYLFKRVFSDKTICIRFLEELLDIRVKDITYKDRTPSAEHAIAGTFAQKGIRLDILLDTGDTLYDIEMQAVDNKDLPQRIRYYQSLIDSQTLQKGKPYSELKPTYIIFICAFDAFGANIPIYERSISIRDFYSERVVSEYADDSHVLVLNAAFTDTVADTDITEFLRYIYDGNYACLEPGHLADMVAQKVEDIKTSREERKGYAMYEDEIRREERDRVIRALKGVVSPEKFAESLNLPLETVKAILGGSYNISSMNLQ